MMLEIPEEFRGTPMIEIGSCIGESTRIFSLFFSPVYSIDPFIDGRAKKENIDSRAEFTKVIGSRNIINIPLLSSQAVTKVPDGVSFIYIDGDHRRKAVEEDLRNYLPKIRKGGYVGGHDYMNKDNIEVQPAVDAVLGVPDMIFIDTSWLKKL